MFKSIFLTNFLLFKKANLDFNDQFNIITGESGAGKSIFLTALRALFGGNIPVQTNAAEIALEFSGNPAFSIWCEEKNIDVLADNILKRSINKGRSRYFVNGSICTKEEVKQLKAILVEDHKQGEQRELFVHDKKLNIIDNNAPYVDTLEKVQHQHSLIKNTKAKLDRLLLDKNQLELLNYQIKELQAISSEISSYEQNNADFIAQNKLLSLAKDSSFIIEEIAGENGILAKLNAVTNMLHKAKIHEHAIYDLALETKEKAQLMAEESHNLQQDTDISQEQLDNLYNQLKKVESLAKKYGQDPMHLHTFLQQLEKEQANITKAFTDYENLQQVLNQQTKEYYQLSESLTKQRQQHINSIVPKINKALKQLDVKGEFGISINELTGIQKSGNDKLEFWLKNQTNHKTPLEKGASGGELSRIKLAINSISNTNTALILDEVDAGLSGFAASFLGDMLVELSQKRQIICISHLAQVAAKASSHFLVYRDEQSHIKELTDTEKVTEIARIIGGINIEDVTLAQAKLMLAKN